MTLDYNGELFATTQAFPAGGEADAAGWRWVCNVQQVEVARVLHFCHNLLHSCAAFMRTANTGGVHWQCASQTYALWQQASACGGRAAAAAELLRSLPGPTHWADRSSVQARASFRSFVRPAGAHRTKHPIDIYQPSAEAGGAEAGGDAAYPSEEQPDNEQGE